MLASYGALLAHGTDLDARGVAAMIRGVEIRQISAALTKVLGFDLCPQLKNLRERKLMMPRGWKVPPELEAITARQVSLPAI